MPNSTQHSSKAPPWSFLLHTPLILMVKEKNARGGLENFARRRCHIHLDACESRADRTDGPPDGMVTMMAEIVDVFADVRYRAVPTCAGWLVGWSVGGTIGPG